MKVTVFGSGYVGLVTGACLAHVGHEVCCVDIDAERVARLNEGYCPIYEPGLEEQLRTGLAEGALDFTTSAMHALKGTEIIFIAVGTPTGEDGSADIRHVKAVARTIGQHLMHDALVVVKSTVPVGTCDEVYSTIGEILACRELTLDVRVASNPEFLKEGAAVADFMRPDRIIVGADCPEAAKVLQRLYAAFNRNHDKLMVMDLRSAELTKYAANAMLATKISFINEIARIAEQVGADVETVRKGIGADPRIGYDFIYPGCGYGGSCFPKDVRALVATAESAGYSPRILPAVEAVNRDQKSSLYTKLASALDGVAGKRIGLWGLSFKPNTDDVREAPSLQLIEALLREGAQVQAYDPQAMDNCASLFRGEINLSMVDSRDAALCDADALVICTEWKSFWSPNFSLLRSQMNGRLIVDGRNLYDPAHVASEGFHYVSVGRHAVTARPNHNWLAAVS